MEIMIVGFFIFIAVILLIGAVSAKANPEEAAKIQREVEFRAKNGTFVDNLKGPYKKYDAIDIIQDGLTDQEMDALQSMKPAAVMISDFIKQDGMSIIDAKNKYGDTFLRGLKIMVNFGDIGYKEKEGYRFLLAGCKTLVRKQNERLPLIRDINKDKFTAEVLIYSLDATIKALNEFLHNVD